MAVAGKTQCLEGRPAPPHACWNLNKIGLVVKCGGTCQHVVKRGKHPRGFPEPRMSAVQWRARRCGFNRRWTRMDANAKRGFTARRRNPTGRSRVRIQSLFLSQIVNREPNGTSANRPFADTGPASPALLRFLPKENRRWTRMNTDGKRSLARIGKCLASPGKAPEPFAFTDRKPRGKRNAG